MLHFYSYVNCKLILLNYLYYARIYKQKSETKLIYFHSEIDHLHLYDHFYDHTRRGSA